MEIVLPTFAPTWKVVTPLLPSRTFVPLNEVCAAIRVISAICCCTSLSRAARSAALFEPFADWTASVRMLCNASVKVDSAPPAVCASDTASFALLTAWFVPLICVVNCPLIARPAASSAALLMRKPDDKRCNACDNDAFEVVKLRCALSESILVLSVNAMFHLLKVVTPARLRPYCCVHFTRQAGGPVTTFKKVIGTPVPFLSGKSPREASRNRRDFTV